MAIAERWIPKPILLETTAGSHRFVWDLRWGSSGANAEIEEEGFGAPRGPRVVPGTYQLKLSVDGNTLTQPLKVTMDPRAQVTAAELNDQQRVALEIFDEVREARKALAEIGAVKKQHRRTAGAIAVEASGDAGGGDEPECANRENRARRQGCARRDHRLDSAATGLSARIARRGGQRSRHSIAGHGPVSGSGSRREGRIADWTRVKSEQLSRAESVAAESRAGGDTDFGDRTRGRIPDVGVI